MHPSFSYISCFVFLVCFLIWGLCLPCTVNPENCLDDYGLLVQQSAASGGVFLRLVVALAFNLDHFLEAQIGLGIAKRLL